MGVCQSATISKRKNKVTKNKQIAGGTNFLLANANDGFDDLRSHLKLQITDSPFNNYTPALQDQLENEFVSGKHISPYQFIEEKKYQDLFKLLYKTCFLKCEPILGNITEDKKDSGLFFFRTVMFLMNNISDLGRKLETGKKIIVESYEHSQKKHDIDRLKKMLSALSELCSEILIYMGLISFYVKPEELSRFLSANDEMLENKYQKVELDELFFEHMKSKRRNDIEMIKSTWVDFLTEPLYNNTKNGEHFMTEFKGAISLTNSQIKNFSDIDEKAKEEILYRIVHMLDPNNCFEVIVGNGVPPFSVTLYNKSKEQ